MTVRRREFLAALPAVGLALWRPGARFQRDELIVLSSNAIKAVLNALAPRFEGATNLWLVVRFAPSSEMKRRIEEGEGFDVAFRTSSVVDIMRNVFERFGIEEAMRAKTRVLSGVTAAEAVASGEAELGFTQISEILPHPGVELAGPLPPEVQVYTTFQAVVGSSARQPEAARRLIGFLTDPSAIPVIRAQGMEPG